MIFRLLPLLVGAYFAYAGAGSLALAVLGEPVDAMVDETVIKAVKEVPAEDGSAPGYVMRTKVAYHFEVCPRQAQATDISCVKAEGSDTMIQRTSYSVLDHDKGYAVPVVFLRSAPWVNAVFQPKHLIVYGLLELLLGLAVMVFEINVFRRERRDRLAVTRAACLPAADPEALWRELDRPLGAGDSKSPRPDKDIQPS
jgi:hypothetical protein